MATVTRENIGVLNDKLTVNIAKEDYLSSFEQGLKKYAKSANIPGFRKGMVPASLVKKMHGQSILTDEVFRLVEKELNNYLTQKKLDVFAQPLPLNSNKPHLDINDPRDYAFDFEIGLKPDININLNDINVTRYKIQVTDEMINDEVNRLQIRNGKMTEPETIENEDNALNLQLTETDAEGNAIESGINKAISLVVKQFTEDVRKQLTGKKKDDTFTILPGKAIEESQKERVLTDVGLDKNNEDDLNKPFNATITKIGLVEKSELNEEFFNTAYPDRGITTEEDFRNAVKEEIQNYLNSSSNNQVHDQIYHHLIDHTQLEFPENFLKRWLQMGGGKAKTAEEAESEYPTFVNQLKWSLISSKLITDNNINVEPDEIKQQAVNQVMSYLGGYGTSDSAWLDEYAGRMLKDKKFVEQTYAQIQTSKLFHLLEGQVHATEESISQGEFTNKQHHHHH